MNWLRKLLGLNRGAKTLEVTVYKPEVTLGWDGLPTILLEGGGVLPRGAEKIINSKYYPGGERGEWPIDPETGKRLPMVGRK